MWWPMSEHQPVLLDAAITGLGVQPGGVYVDGTYGRGGHSAALLNQLDTEGRLLAFDKDPQACAHAWKTLRGEPRFNIERASFAQLNEVLVNRGLLGCVNGILLDLGVSSPQLETAERGFSFARSGPLDMRMDPQAGISVADWLAAASESEIARILKLYGEEPFASRIAHGVVAAREQASITTTGQLAEIIRACIPQRVAATSRIHPATRSFQALRIHINDELSDLQRALEQSLLALAPGGRLVVISFHSLEDRIVKRFMRDQARPEPPLLPMAPVPLPLLNIIGKPHQADSDEVAGNPRARSAMLRIAERTRHPVPK